MPDMTLCGGGDCPLKARCYRFRAVAYGRQSYFGRVPFVAETGKCDSFSDIAALEPTQASIQTRAYYLWQRAGQPEGRSDELWHQARAQLEAELGERLKPL